MSLVGKKPITLPEKVKLSLAGGIITAVGPRGTLSISLPRSINVSIKEGEVAVSRENDSRIAKEGHGTARALINNMIIGVNEGFSRELDIRGVGFRAAVQGKNLVLNLGFSHQVDFPLPEGVEAKVVQNTRLILSSSDNQKLGVVAAKIRSLRPPEPYKGKGIRYADEHVKQKVGKTAVG